MNALQVEVENLHFEDCERFPLTGDCQTQRNQGRLAEHTRLTSLPVQSRHKGTHSREYNRQKFT
jgi:hypothetical protein